MMKALKIIGIVLLIVIGVLAIIPMFLSKTVQLERSVTIEAPLEVVFNQVNYHKEWEKHDPWKQADSTLLLSYEGTDGEPGSKRIFKSEKSGNGEIERVSSIKGVEIREFLRMEGMGEDSTYFLFEKTEEGVKVTQGFKSELGYFWRYFGLFLDKMLAPFFESGLNNLKTYCEANKDVALYDIIEETYPGNSFLGIRDTISFEELNTIFDTTYKAIYTFFDENGISPNGNPQSIYYLWDEENEITDLAIVVPVSNFESIPMILDTFSLSSNTVLTLVYKGDYEGSYNAHMAIWNHLTKKGYAFQGPVLEEYIKGPANESNPKNWETKISYFVTK
jgi:effector-binding domain-containing protein